MKKKWIVQGKTITSEEEYAAVQRDLKKIELLKNKYSLNNPNDVIELYSALQTLGYNFESFVGREFDDSVYEKYVSVCNKDKSIDKIQTKKNKANSSSNEDISEYVKDRKNRFEKQRKLVIIIASIIGFACLLYFGFYVYLSERNKLVQAQLSDRVKTSQSDMQKYDPANDVNAYVSEEISNVEQVKMLEKYINLYNDNKKLIGWLKIDDTLINYPVLQTTDNEYYLDHGYHQEKDKNGSIFLDCECSILPRSTNLIIYGHHMKSGNMFGTLNKYEKTDYYNEHKYITFDTLYEEGNYEVMYVFRSKVYSEEEIVFKYYQFTEPNSEAEFDSAMTEMSELSIIDTGVTASYGDKLLTLSTCDYAQKGGRFVVVAKKIK